MGRSQRTCAGHPLSAACAVKDRARFLHCSGQPKSPYSTEGRRGNEETRFASLTKEASGVTCILPQCRSFLLKDRPVAARLRGDALAGLCPGRRCFGMRVRGRWWLLPSQAANLLLRDRRPVCLSQGAGERKGRSASGCVDCIVWWPERAVGASALFQVQ